MLNAKFSVFIIFFSVLIISLHCGNENSAPKTENTTNYNKLDWLVGVWEGKQGDAKVFENWERKSYRLMEGISYTTENNRRVYTQNMKLEQSNNKIFYILEPMDKNQITLNINEITDDKAVFENKQNEFPQKIIYKKIGENKMSVTLEGANAKEETKLIYKKKMNL